MSMLSSQADPPTLKNVGFMKAGARFSENQGFGSKDALDGVLGLLLGSFWVLLGAHLVFLRAFGGTLHAQNFFLVSFPGQIYCCFSALLSLLS